MQKSSVLRKYLDIYTIIKCYTHRSRVLRIDQVYMQKSSVISIDLVLYAMI